ncbi:MAG: hypothetical protein K9G49_03080 [Taibaiella sp.]|nr:hypothetical protein [Taibaiella sp.]
MLLSLVVIIDLLTRFSDLTAHYSEDGVLPLSLLFSHYWNPWYWSIVTVSGNIVFTCIFFIVTITAALLLFAGYRPRIMTVICWVGMLSIQNRNPVLYQGGDDLLRMLLFWSVFLPLNTDITEKTPKKINTVATMAIMSQALFGMFFSGLFKGSEEWWKEGSAIYYALSLDQLARPAGLWLSRQYSLTVVLTRFVYIVEISLFPLFLMPFWREGMRTIIAAAIACLFTGIMLCMMIGIFPLCYLATVALFLPHSLWEQISKSGINAKMVTALQWCQRWLIYEKRCRTFSMHWVSQSVLGFTFTLILLWNIASLPVSPIYFPFGLDPVMYTLRLNQSWGMFAPTVMKQDGWLVCAATLNDNTTADLNAPDLKLSFDKPANVLARYKNDRWRKYTEQLFIGSNIAMRPHLASYLIKNWNRNQHNDDKKVKDLSIIYMLEPSVPFNSKSSVTKVTLFETGRVAGKKITPRKG